MKLIRYILLAALLWGTVPAQADWGTDAGERITIGGGGSVLSLPGEGHLAYDGHWAVSPPGTTVVDSVFNLSPLPLLSDSAATALETVYVSYHVQNRGNCFSSIGVSLGVAAGSDFTPGISILHDVDGNGLYTAADTAVGSGLEVILGLPEDSTAYLIFALGVPPPLEVSQDDSAFVTVTVRGNNNTGTDDLWPKTTMNNGDLQTDTMALAVSFGQMVALTASLTETVVTADDSLVITVMARDNGGFDHDVTGRSFFVSSDSVRGSMAGNVYYAGLADTHRITVLYENLSDTVDVVVTPGRLASLDIGSDSAAVFAGGLSVIGLTGHDADSNLTTGVYVWTLSDSSVGVIADGSFRALAAGSTWAYVSAGGGLADSVFITVSDNLPPDVRIVYDDTVTHSAAVMVSMFAADTAGGHVGSSPDNISYLYNLDSTGWQAADTNTLVLYPLADGTHRLLVAAMDEYGNVDTLAGKTAGTFEVRLNRFRLQANRWQMIAVPKDVQGRTPGQLLSADSALAANLFRWDDTLDPDPFTLQYADVTGDSLRSGHGYWYHGSDSAEMVLDSAAAFVTDTVTMDLAAGWSQIGNPHGWPVDWRAFRFFAPGYGELSAAEAVGAALIENALYGFAWDADSAGYTMLSSVSEEPMATWQGYWLKANEPCQLIMPGKPYFKPAADSGAVNKAAARYSVNDWQLRLEARSAGVRDLYNFVGVRPGAAAGDDIYDVSEPPGMRPYVRLAFGGSRLLAADFRSETGEWYFTVSTDQAHEPVVLSWPGLGQLPVSLHAHLYDLKTGAVTALADAQQYRFRAGAAGGERHFKLVVAPAGGFVPESLPEKLSVAALEPNPFKTETRIRFTVPAENVRASTVRLGVYRTDGRKVATLLQGRLTAGSYYKMWDGTDDLGARLGAGTYVIRVSTEQTQAVSIVEIVR